jgi:hypothetical protein
MKHEEEQLGRDAWDPLRGIDCETLHCIK